MTDTTSANPTSAGLPRRPRPRFRSVEVVEVRRLSSWLVEVALAGDLDGFAVDLPTRHIKVLIPGDGEHSVVLPDVGSDGAVWPVGQPRPAMRTYTPRRFDPPAGLLDVQFVVHGEGPASTWADRAAPGDRLGVAGPGGRFPLELAPGPWVIAGDESAIPAIGTLLDVLPAGATARVFLEVRDRSEPVDIGGGGVAELDWLARSGADDPGAGLLDALATTPLTDDTTVWVACEAVAVRRIRAAVLQAGTVRPDRLVTRGYWRAGEANHPDHDHGAD